jgi:hypothetical protein
MNTNSNHLRSSAFGILLLIASTLSASVYANAQSALVSEHQTIARNSANRTTGQNARTATQSANPAAIMRSTRATFPAQWTPVEGATGYLLDVSKDSSFTAMLPGYTALDVANTAACVVTGLEPGTTYYYRVRAYSDGSVSATSPTMEAMTAAAGGIIINPVFDDSITSDSQSAEIESTINQAIATYEALFTNQITVTIHFRYSDYNTAGQPLDSGIVAQSYTGLAAVPWNDYISALSNRATTPNDRSAVASLPSTAQTDNIIASTANGRAVGLGTPAHTDGGDGNVYDGIITLNSDQSFQFYRRPVGGGSFDALAAVEHEMDEVLGLGSSISHFAYWRPQDLFSWSGAGARSVSTDGERYFSIDGGFSGIVDFNQDSAGDFGDWASSGDCPHADPLVQDAFGCPDQTSDVTSTSPEAVNLDVIGYDVASRPIGSELLLNGGFESSLTGWTLAGNGNLATTYPHSGSSYAVLGGGDFDSATLRHDPLYVPSDASFVTLSYWLNITSSETAAQTYDQLNVTIIAADGTSYPVAQYSEANQSSAGAGAYVQYFFDLTAFRGQSIQIQFSATTDSSNSTTFRIDDVSLTSDGTPPQLPIANGAIIALIADANNLFVTADNAGQQPLIADRSALGLWEQFQILDLGNGSVALRSMANGSYVTAEDTGSSPLVANRTTIGQWEQFTLIDQGAGNFAILARANGKYVCADNGGSSSLIANRTSAGTWEEFRMVFMPAVKPVNVTVGLQTAATNAYVSAENAGAAPLVANRSSEGGWEQFRFVDVGNGNIALQSLVNGAYVTAENGGASPLIANRGAIGTWEQFQLLDAGGGSFALRAVANGLYVSSDAPNDIIIASKTYVGSTEQFILDVSLRSQANNSFVSAENAGQQPLIANRAAIGTWEQFQIVNTGHGYFALKAKANGQYVCAENAGNTALIADRSAIGSWEQFQWIVGGDGNIALRALINGMFVSAENGGTSPLIANRPSAQAWEEFH